MDDEPIDRRDFLNLSWKLLGAGLAVEAAWTTFDILDPRPSGAFGSEVEAGNVEEFPEGTVRYFLDGRFYVTSNQGVLFALYQKCPHLGCRVPFCSTSKQFECPCHGSVFNIKGEYIQGPTPRGMDRFAIRVQGDRVVVDTGKVDEGPARGILTGPSEPAGPPCLGEEGGTGMDEHVDEHMDEHMDEASTSPGAMP